MSMSVMEFHVPVRKDSAALEALVKRAHDAVQAGNDAEFRAYLTGIFEILDAERKQTAPMRLSA